MNGVASNTGNQIRVDNLETDRWRGVLPRCESVIIPQHYDCASVVRTRQVSDKCAVKRP